MSRISLVGSVIAERYLVLEPLGGVDRLTIHLPVTRRLGSDRRAAGSRRPPSPH
jgi:hypothetical protein